MVKVGNKKKTIKDTVVKNQEKGSISETGDASLISALEKRSRAKLWLNMKMHHLS